MTTIALGYAIHNFLNKKHWCESTPTGEGTRSFKIRAAVVLDGDIVVRWSDDGSHKTLWRVTSASSVDKFYSIGHMEDLMQKGDELA